MVRIGGDRVIVGPTNWSAMSHQELYDAICGGNEPSAVFDVSDKWITLGNHMLDSSNTLHQRITESASGWQGDAAESSRAAITQLVDWGGKASQTAQFMGHQLNQQGQIMATAKANMPKPVPFQLANVSTQPGLSGFGNSLVDAQPLQQAADEAHARAIDVATQMEQGSMAVDKATPEFEPVPVVLKRSRMAPATAGRPMAPAEPTAQPATPVQTGVRPTAPYQAASAPAGGAPGQPVPLTQQPTRQPTLPDRIPAAGRGSVVPGGTTTSDAPTVTMGPQAQGGGCAGSPGSFAAPGDPGGVPPMTTTTSGAAGGFPVPAPPMPGDGGYPSGGGAGPGPTSWGGGDPGWDGVVGTGGGSPFGPEGIGAGPVISRVGAAGTFGGRGSGAAGGVGGAVEEEMPSYRPGSISARLGSGSGLPGSGSGAAGAAERAAAGASRGAGSGGSGAVRGTAEEPGMAGSPAARKRKEDDREHKSAGYVQGEDIFEPLGGELPPPVIGDRRSKRPR